MQRAVRTYLDHLSVERGLAANTLSSYRRDLRRYAGFLAQRGVDDLAGVGEQTVTEFLMRLREGDADHPPLSASSAGRAVVAVRGIDKFAVRDGLAVADPAAAVRPPAPARRLPKALPLADIERILEAAGAAGTALALRDRALLELLYGCGAASRRLSASTSTTWTWTPAPSCCAVRAARSGSSPSARWPPRRWAPT